MSKTMKMTVSFPMTLVFTEETLKDFREAREEVRKLTPEEIAKVTKGETKARMEMFASDMSDERLLEIILRSGIREHMRNDFLKEIAGSEAAGRLGSVKVTFETPMVPRSCQGCIKTECTLDARLTNSGCQFKTTGLREACGGPRWTETV